MKHQSAIIASIAAFLGTQAQAQAVPDSVRGVPLGITLAEFRTLSHPEAGQWNGVTVRCHRNSYSAEGVMQTPLLLPDADGELGVQRCTWFGTPSGVPYIRSAHNLSISFGNGGLYPGFDFIEVDGEWRLFRVLLVGNLNQWADVYGPLESRFGPAQTSQSPVQNRAGASFPALTATWEIGGYTLQAQERCGRIDFMCVEYRSDDLYGRYQSAMSAAAVRGADNL